MIDIFRGLKNLVKVNLNNNNLKMLSDKEKDVTQGKSLFLFLLSNV